MSEQHALWSEPPWTASWPEGQRVRSIYTDNTGTITAVDPLGRHLLILWDATAYRDAAECRHGSERGLVKA